MAGSALAGARAETRQTASALLTWTLLLLVPVSVAVAVAARPSSLGAARQRRTRNLQAGMLTVGSRMLVVFAPQIVLYGLAVVGYGILQAHRRFSFPALAPVLSSIVVAAAYLAFVPLDDGSGVNDLPLPGGAHAVGRHHRRGGRTRRHRAGPGAPAQARGCGRRCTSRTGSRPGCGRSPWPESRP